MWCVQRRACPRPLHLNLFPTSTPPLINYDSVKVGILVVSDLPHAEHRCNLVATPVRDPAHNCCNQYDNPPPSPSTRLEGINQPAANSAAHTICINPAATSTTHVTLGKTYKRLPHIVLNPDHIGVPNAPIVSFLDTRFTSTGLTPYQSNESGLGRISKTAGQTSGLHIDGLVLFVPSKVAKMYASLFLYCGNPAP